MSVVRIPKPDEDAFPWPRVAIASVIGAALGLGIAWCGMETDRSAALDQGAEESGPPEPPPATPPSDEPEPQVVLEAIAPDEPDAPEPQLDAATPVEAEEPTGSGTPIAPPGETTVEAATTTGGGLTPSEARGPVTLRRGRVAYLRCDGVPQREGPFPCPRDEPLEAAVWSALAEVSRCARSPGAGQADLVVDLADDAAPTIRTRDTFPPDTPRTDDAALLACTSGSLGNVRSSLSPRRLVVSFRLTLDPADR